MSDDEAAPEPEAAEPEAVEPEAPAKKRKKKKRRDQADESFPRARFPDWPKFAREYPPDPALEGIVDAFEKGNYARVRESAQRLLDERPERPDDVRSAARDLLRRIEPDPIARYLLIGACLLLVFLAGWYWMHKGGA